jgi:hypothetical protein
VRRRRVDETNAAADEHTEGEAVAKGGDDRELGEGFAGVEDPKIGAKESDEAVDEDVLGPKTMEQLVPKRGGDGNEDRGGGAEPERKENPTENGAETRTKRKLGFFFFFFILAPRKRKETWTMKSATAGAASPWFTGAGSKTC